MSKETSKKGFWARMKWWLYAIQWVFTGIGIYQFAVWMSDPQNRQNALIGLVIGLGFLLFGAIAVWRARAVRKKNATSSTSTKKRVTEASAEPPRQERAQRTQETRPDRKVQARQGSEDGYTVEAKTSSAAPEDEDARMREIEEELSRHK